MKVVLVIPALDEGATLARLVDELLQLPEHTVAHVIVVDDGSTDASVERLPAQPRLGTLHHASNEGKARALIDGMQRALALDADLIVTMDGDGQHRTQDVARLVQAARAHDDRIIIGARLADRDAIPGARYRANRFANFWVAWAAGWPVVDSQSGFRAYPARIVRAVLPALDRRYPAGARGRRKGFVFDSEILIEAGRRRCATLAVTIPALYGAAGALRASHFRPVADITQIVLMVAGHLLRQGMNLPGLWRSLRGEGAAEASEVTKNAEG